MSYSQVIFFTGTNPANETDTQNNGLLRQILFYHSLELA